MHSIKKVLDKISKYDYNIDMFKPFPVKKPDNHTKGEIPGITFLEGNRGIFFNSGFVDTYNILKARQFWSVIVNEKTKEIRLEKLESSANSELLGRAVRTAKAGGTTKAGNDRIMIRMPEILNRLKKDTHTFSVYPIVSQNPDVITFSYKDPYEQ